MCWRADGGRGSRGASAPAGKVGDMLAIYDGELMEADEVLVSATDDGLLRGDGCRRVRLYDGRPFGLHDHLAPERSLGGEPAPAVRRGRHAGGHRALLEAGRPDDGTVRLVVTRGGRRIAVLEPLPGWPRRSRCNGDLPADADHDRRQVAVLRGQHAGNPGGPEHGADEALLVPPDGRVLEAPTSTFFCSLDGTRGSRRRCPEVLDSITRRRLLEESRRSTSRAMAEDELAGAGRRSWPRPRARCCPCWLAIERHPVCPTCQCR